jgi:ATP-dependent DNA helicase
MPSSSVGSLSSSSRQPTTAPSSSPPAIPGPENPRYVDEKHLDFAEEEARLLKLQEEEEKAQVANQVAEKRRIAAARRKYKKKKILSPEERTASAGALDELLLKSQAFSNILLGKTKAMGRVGTGLDGRALAEKGVKIVDQPNCMTGGQMRDYQLEGVTWMSEVCEQGMSGILADEMGLGKSPVSRADAQRQLTFCRQNYTDHRTDCVAA